MGTGDLRGRSISNDGSLSNYRTLVSLIVGLIVGSYMAQLFIISTASHTKWSTYYKQLHAHIRNPSYEGQIEEAVAEKKYHEHKHSLENTSVAQNLYKEVRVLCWILTTENQNRAKSVRKTWGKRCNKLIFFTTGEFPEPDVVALNFSEGKNFLWGKTKEAMKYIYENHFEDYDWFFKADDDTYAIMENMRYFLYPYSPETPIYFGARFKPMIRQGFMSGGAGFVLSKEAVRRFVTEAIPNPDICKQTETGEADIHIGWCLQNVKVIAGDSRDSQRRGRFFPFKPETHLNAKRDNHFWYWKYIYYKTDEGLDCCSDYAITFHKFNSGDMLVFDFLVYHLRPYGIVNYPEELPKKLEAGETLPPPLEPPTPPTWEEVIKF